MKRLYIVASLTFAALILSGCPDTKLPTPIPKVPEPKAQSKLGFGAAADFALQHTWMLDTGENPA